MSTARIQPGGKEQGGGMKETLVGDCRGAGNEAEKLRKAQS